MSEHSDFIRSLSKQWFKTGDNRFLDELQDVTKRWVDKELCKPPLRLRIAERYKNGSLDIHFHFRLAFEVALIKNIPIPQFLVFEPSPSHREHGAEVVIPKAQMGVKSNESSDSQGVMFVGVVEPRQGFERIASLVRLQTRWVL